VPYTHLHKEDRWLTYKQAATTFDGSDPGRSTWWHPSTQVREPIETEKNQYSLYSRTAWCAPVSFAFIAVTRY
jgi:hypothetical protein